MKTPLACLMAASLTVLSCSSVHAATTLRMAHFWPGASGINTQIFEQWAEAVEEDSGGDLRVQVFPAGTLAKANDIYEATVNGIADIGATAQGYTAGAFRCHRSSNSREWPIPRHRAPAYCKPFTMTDIWVKSTTTRVCCSCSPPVQVTSIPWIPTSRYRPIWRGCEFVARQRWQAISLKTWEQAR